MNFIVPNSDKNSGEGSTQNVYARFWKICRDTPSCNFLYGTRKMQFPKSSGTTVKKLSVEYLQIQQILLNYITRQSALSTAL